MPSSPIRLPYSDLVGRAVVGADKRRFGRAHDLVAAVSGAGDLHIVGLAVRRWRSISFVPAQHVARWPGAHHGPIVLADGAPASVRFERRAGELLVGRDILDHQVIDLADTEGPRLVRVNDVVLDSDADAWRLYGVDAAQSALVRRLLPRALRGRRSGGAIVRWADSEMFACDIAGATMAPRHEALARCHPADIARLADASSTTQAVEIVASLPDDLAADTLEEMIDARQANVIEALEPERATTLIGLMAPDAAADVLADLSPELVASLLRLMEPAQAAGLHALLTYAKDTAGGLMTTDYLAAPLDLVVREAVPYLRPQMKAPDWPYYIYIVENMGDRLLRGVVSLRDLLLADPDRRMAEIMTRVLRHAGPDDGATAVARTMSEYNLTALPVVDRTGRLLGIVSVDDALAVILPEGLRRRIPRVFS